MNFITELFRLVFINIQASFSFMHGLFWISKLKTPIITTFGGHYPGVHDSYKEAAYKVTYKCVERGYSVLSGGGPGIMQASNCGAFEASLKKRDTPLRTFGIGVQGVDIDFINVCAPVLQMNSFYTRKWLLTRYSAGFVIFPGGIGTADEFFEIMNLMKLQKIESRPIILFGSAYWKPLIDWFELSAIQQGFIALECRGLFYVVDDAQEALRILDEAIGAKSIEKT